MTTEQAAQIIGCSSAHVRLLIRRGLCKAHKRASTNTKVGYEYDVSATEARRIRDTKHQRGRPRKSQGASK